MTDKPHVLIVEARFYDDILDALLDGATRALKKAGASYEVVTVPGALEIPAAIRFAVKAQSEGKLAKPFDGFVALGCVIRGETTHYETVCNESARGLMDLTLQHSLAIGNGILLAPLTVSAGVAAYPADGLRAAALVAVADERMYAQKRATKRAEAAASSERSQARRRIMDRLGEIR